MVRYARPLVTPLFRIPIRRLRNARARQRRGRIAGLGPARRSLLRTPSWMLHRLQLGRRYPGRPVAKGRRHQKTVKAAQLSRLRLPECSWASWESKHSSRASAVAMDITEEGEVRQNMTSIKIKAARTKFLLRQLGSRQRGSLDSPERPGITVVVEVDRRPAGLRARSQPRVEASLGLQGTLPRASEGRNRRALSVAGDQPRLGRAGRGVGEGTDRMVCHRAGRHPRPHRRPRQR